MRHLQGHPGLNLNLLAKIDSLNESPYQALQYSYTLLPFDEQIIEKEGPEDPKRRQQVHLVNSPMSHANVNWS